MSNRPMMTVIAVAMMDIDSVPPHGPPNMRVACDVADQRVRGSMYHGMWLRERVYVEVVISIMICFVCLRSLDRATCLLRLIIPFNA